MNWRPSNHLTADICAFTSGKSGGGPLQLEGSLAAVAILAPVIPMFPPVIFRRFGRRRSQRQKC